MARPAHVLAEEAVTKASVNLATSAFQDVQGRSYEEAKRKVFTTARPHDDFPHIIVTLPQETTSTLASDKDSSVAAAFPTFRTYAKGRTGTETVATLASFLVERMTADGFSIDGWQIIKNVLASHLPVDQTTADRDTIHGRQSQIELHLQQT